MSVGLLSVAKHAKIVLTLRTSFVLSAENLASKLDNNFSRQTDND